MTLQESPATTSRAAEPITNPEPARAGPSLKALAIRGSLWTFAGYGASMVLRLGSSMVMTRLLFPEAFGLMTMVGVVLYGLEMMSDLGIGPTIIFDPRGDDPRFLDTAWTVQIARGIALWAIACAISWPAAAFYREPRLRALISVAALSAVLSGFTSTRIHTARRGLALGKLTAIDLFSQASAIAVSVVCALHWRSVWALVAGGLTSPALRLVLSHTYLPGARNRFHWDAESARVLRGYGKWIYLSSILFFVAMQGDRLMVGRLLSMTALGIYAIAMSLVEPLVNLNLQVWRSVMLPALSRVYRETPARFSEVFYRGRLRTDLLFAAGSGAVMLLGTWIVGFLYDPRYAAAGALLQIVALRGFLSAIAESLEQCLSAMRLPKYVTISHVGRTAWILAGIPLGWHLAGLKGIAMAAATSELPVVLTFWFLLGRMRVARLRYEVRTFAFGACGLAVGAFLAAIIPATWHVTKPW